MSDPSPLVLQFQKDVDRRLKRIGHRILKQSRDRVDFDERFRWFDPLATLLLDKLCKWPQHVVPGEVNPQKRAQRKRTRKKRETVALKKALKAFARDDQEDDLPPPLFTPGDKWEMTVQEGNPELLFPNVKYAVRAALETTKAEVRSFLVERAARRFAGGDGKRRTPAEQMARRRGRPSKTTAAMKAEADVMTRRVAERQKAVLPILKHKGWTTGTLATRSGVGKATVYEYLNGKRARISEDNLKALADTLGLRRMPTNRNRNFRGNPAEILVIIRNLLFDRKIAFPRNSRASSRDDKPQRYWENAVMHKAADGIRGRG